MRNVSDTICTENQNIHFILNTFFVVVENRAVYDMMSKNMIELERLQMAARCMLD